jgi:putative ABC transport system substrate-binding protein
MQRLSVAFLLGLLVAPLAAADAQPLRVPRVGILRPGSPMGQPDPFFEAFRAGMRELGYVEGRTIVLEPRWGEGKLDRVPALAAELVGLPVDVIVTGSSLAAQVAQQATRTIPIVMATGDPAASGLVTNLAHPGGNVTGLSGYDTELGGKRLQLLKETSPRIADVAVLWNPAYTGMLSRFKQVEAAAPAVGVTIRPVEVRSLDDFAGAFAAMTQQRPTALIVLADPLTLVHRQRIIDFATEQRLPGAYESRDFVEAGGLMSYGPSLAGMWRRAATFVDKILKGAKPGDLPIEQPTKFELVMNLKTAKALGLTIPQSVLVRADEVIQ